MKLKLASFILALAAGVPALAAEPAGKAYAGFAAGGARATMGTDTVGKVQGGMWLGDQYGVEVSYFNSSKLKGADLSYRLRVPVGEKVDLTAKVGIASTRSSAASSTTTSAVAGFGLSYSITTNVRIRADVDTRRAKAAPGGAEKSVNTVTVGVEKAF
jgi:outer membrane autotransporter protein